RPSVARASSFDPAEGTRAPQAGGREPGGRRVARLRFPEAHSAEAHMGGAAAIIGEDDLVGRQGNLGSVSEDDGGSRGTVLQDRQLRHDLWLAGDAGTGNELDEQRIRVHSRHAYAGPRRRTRWLPEPK